MSHRLENKVAIITGGTSGIGLATAKLFIAEGARVVVSSRRRESVPTVQKDLGPAAVVVQADAADETDARALVDRAVKLGDGIDVLFLNAGIVRPSLIEHMDRANYDDVMAVNLRGPWLTLRAAIPYLRRGATVVLNTSVANESGTAGLAAYAASKAGLRSLARTASAELIPRGVRVNAISPGPVETPIYEKLGVSEAEAAAVKAQMIAAVPLGRMGTAQEVAQAVLFLASDDSSFVVGAELVVDGGASQI